MSDQHAEIVRPMWQRCKCDQWGRCLVDCPTADQPWDLEAFLRRTHSDGDVRG